MAQKTLPQVPETCSLLSSSQRPAFESHRLLRFEEDEHETDTGRDVTRRVRAQPHNDFRPAGEMVEVEGWTMRAWD